MKRLHVVIIAMILGVVLSPSTSAASVSWPLNAFARSQGQETGSPCDVAKANDSDENPASSPVSLAGKLGGSRADAEALYGSPIEDKLFIEYKISGCGTVFISFFQDQETIDISAFSRPRDSEKSLTAPDSVDWTVAEARAIIKNFLPSDAAEVGVITQDKTLIIVEGYSPTLAAIVSQAAYDFGDNTPSYGGYEYVINLTTEGKVSWITVQLNIEEELRTS